MAQLYTTCMHSLDFQKSEIRRISKWRHVSPDKAIFKKTTVICVKFTHKRSPTSAIFKNIIHKEQS